MLFALGDVIIICNSLGDDVDKHFSTRILLLDYRYYLPNEICQPLFCFCCTVCVNMAELSARSR